MAWGRKLKEEDNSTVVSMYERMLEEAKSRIEHLEAEKKHLMDALLAVKSPDAYRDMVVDRSLSRGPAESPDDLRTRDLTVKTISSWFNELERPLFTSPEDVEQFILKKDTMAKLQDDLGPEEAEFQSTSIHNNNES